MSGKFMLIGHPLSHSYSPEIQSLFGVEDYSLCDLDETEVELFLKSGDFDGLNVTIPYKRTVLPYLDEISPEAERIGAVNTVVRRGGKLFGTNTDYFGFSVLLDSVIPNASGKKALVLGSGGSSHTVSAVLRDRGAEVVVISRTGENNYLNLSRHTDAALLVNTTPVGMYPNANGSPLSLDGFPHLEGVIDLIYNPAKTELILDAEERNIPCRSGLSMLVAQAKQSAESFLGHAIPAERLALVTEAIEKQKKNVVLIGMPGVGKTSVGRELAALLRRTFVDSDEEIETRFSLSPADFIREQGEDAFRRAEAEVLAALCKESSRVVSTGGGTVILPENRREMKRNSTVVLLTRPLDKLARENRPISLNEGVDALWNERKDAYFQAADAVIPCAENAQKTALSIRKELSL